MTDPAPEPRVMPRDVLREALLVQVGKQMTDARVDELMRQAAIPLHGRGPSVDLQARHVAASLRVVAQDIIAAALAAVPSESDAGLPFTEEFAAARAAHNAEEAALEPTPSRKAADALLDAVEQAVQSEALPANIHARLRDAFNEVVDQANKTTLAKHGLVFEDSDAGLERCICDYDRPSRVKVGCPVHYPDPGADAEGETA